MLLFSLFLQGELVTMENTDTYTIANVSRDATGEYKCSLTDDTSMEATRNITVTCKKTKIIISLEVEITAILPHTSASVSK